MGPRAHRPAQDSLRSLPVSLRRAPACQVRGTTGRRSSCRRSSASSPPARARSISTSCSIAVSSRRCSVGARRRRRHLPARREARHATTLALRHGVGPSWHAADAADRDGAARARPLPRTICDARARRAARAPEQALAARLHARACVLLLRVDDAARRLRRRCCSAARRRWPSRRCARSRPSPPSRRSPSRTRACTAGRAARAARRTSLIDCGERAARSRRRRAGAHPRGRVQDRARRPRLPLADAGRRDGVECARIVHAVGKDAPLVGIDAADDAPYLRESLAQPAPTVIEDTAHARSRQRRRPASTQRAGHALVHARHHAPARPPARPALRRLGRAAHLRRSRDRGHAAPRQHGGAGAERARAARPRSAPSTRASPPSSSICRSSSRSSIARARSCTSTPPAAPSPQRIGADGTDWRDAHRRLRGLRPRRHASCPSRSAAWCAPSPASTTAARADARRAGTASACTSWRWPCRCARPTAPSRRC